jgi:hypothetical protein
MDVLMALTRKLPDGEWKLEYRFRYYRDDEAFDSADEKSRWTATFPEKLEESEVVRRVSPVLQKLKAMTRMEVDVTTIESDEPELVVHLMRQKPHFHMKYEEKTS